MMKTFIYSLISLCLLLSISACTTPLIIVGTAASVGTAVAITDRRPTVRIVEDQSVETQITDFIYGHEEIGKKIHVQVTSYNGSVLLTGEVPDTASKNIILDKANSLRYVDNVVDALEVKPNISFSDRNNDAWLTAKAKSSLMFNKNIITNTKVVTSDKKIYLLGLVNNNEAKRIIGIVNKIEGVDAVIPLFDSNKDTLDENLTAASFSIEEQQIDEKKILDEKLQQEDEIEVKSYVLPAPVTLSDDAQ